jgi:hypothetical protein
MHTALATPWWVEVNVLVAFIFFYCLWLSHPLAVQPGLTAERAGFLTPILYYSNVWNGQCVGPRRAALFFHPCALQVHASLLQLAI